MEEEEANGRFKGGGEMGRATGDRVSSGLGAVTSCFEVVLTGVGGLVESAGFLTSWATFRRFRGPSRVASVVVSVDLFADVPDALSAGADGAAILSLSALCWKRHMKAVHCSPLGQGMCLRSTKDIVTRLSSDAVEVQWFC